MEEKKEEALEDGLKRLNSLQQEADGLSEQPPPLAAPADFARELAELRVCVQALQVERDDLRAEVARENVEGRPKNARSLAVPSPQPRDGRQFCAIQVCPQFLQCHGDSHRPSRFECQVEPSFQSDVAEWHRSISAKYGLRGIRVGEASHPGLVSRATSRRTQMDSDSDAPLVNSGRFMALLRDNDGSEEDVGVEVSKRLRVTRRDRAEVRAWKLFGRDLLRPSPT